MNRLLLLTCLFLANSLLYGQQPGLQIHNEISLLSTTETQDHTTSIKSVVPDIRRVMLYPELLAFEEKQQDVPLVFSAEALPFFCKIEHKIEKAGGWPMKFRLGDVQQMDALERSCQRGMQEVMKNILNIE